MERRRLPVGIQTLGNIRARNCYYVDKTPHVLRLVEEDTHYFLSRPRRFGKSLLIDTLKELFEGNGELFRGLAIHDEWDWSVKYPVVRFDFSGGEFVDPDGVREEVSEQLEAMAAQAGVEVGRARPAILFRRLIRALRRKAGRQVVVLVDEYDKPILDALPVPEVARSNREFLRSLYGGIKACDADIRFCFLTGVSKFSKAGLFSGLNNLRDITLSPAYATICGYTGRRPRYGVRARARGSRPGRDPALVQRLQLARGGQGLQPVRHPAAVPGASVQELLVRDRDAGIPRRDAAAARCPHRRSGRHDGGRDPAGRPSMWSASRWRRCCSRRAT